MFTIYIHKKEDPYQSTWPNASDYKGTGVQRGQHYTRRVAM